MKKIYISQPVSNKSLGEIKEERYKVEKWANDKGYFVVNSFFSPDVSSHTLDPDFLRSYEALNGLDKECLDALGHNISRIAMADAVIFLDDWMNNRECMIEYNICAYYNIQAITWKIYSESPCASGDDGGNRKDMYKEALREVYLYLHRHNK